MRWWRVGGYGAEEGGVPIRFRRRRVVEDRRRRRVS